MGSRAVSKWTKVDDYYWRLGRYTVCRALVFVENPLGAWVYQGWFKASPDADAEIVSPERRHRFEDAARDCMAHAKSHSPEQRQQAA
jgi:hypothetical protein